MKKKVLGSEEKVVVMRFMPVILLAVFGLLLLGCIQTEVKDTSLNASNVTLPPVAPPANPNASAGNQTNLTPNTPPVVLPNVTNETREVTLDYIYTTNCNYCHEMEAVLVKLEAELPADRFIVRYWNMDYKDQVPEIAEIYAKYRALNFLVGYPTFVINGNSPVAGNIPENDFRTWVCIQFNEPRPAACS